MIFREKPQLLQHEESEHKRLSMEIPDAKSEDLRTSRCNMASEDSYVDNFRIEAFIQSMKGALQLRNPLKKALQIGVFDDEMANYVMTPTVISKTNPLNDNDNGTRIPTEPDKDGPSIRMSQLVKDKLALTANLDAKFQSLNCISNKSPNESFNSNNKYPVSDNCVGKNGLVSVRQNTSPHLELKSRGSQTRTYTQS